VLLTVWLVLLVSIRQIRKNLKPLDRLQEGTRQLASGQLDTRVNVTSGDEFEELAVSFNQMASQLGRQFDALAMRREISAVLSASKPLDETLQACGDLLARHLGLARVGIWITAGDGAALGLRASTGIPAGEQPLSFPLEPERLEALARARRPYATNTLAQDARLCDADRAAREGLVAFVAHPLLVDERFVGLAAAYGTHPLDGLDLSGFGAAAGDIARCVDGKRVAEALQDSEVQLRQLQKMEAVGRLAGGIAHDFNNLLTVIMGRSNLLLHRLAADHPHRKSLENIEETTQRAALLTRQLLAFSRKQVLTPTVLDVEGVVAGMLELFQRLIGENIELAFTPGSELGRVRIDRGQAEQVLVNLVVNARDAMPEGGRITIEIGEVALDEGDAVRLAGLPGGPYIVLTVSDTGTGMDEHTKARIFEPFFTTKEPGKGTGLGLATVYGIVRQSEGGITVESQLGVGTSFKIYLPRVDGVVAEETTAVAPVGCGTETVLLVEDEPHVRSLVETVLAEHGYHVLAAGRPGEAVRLAEGHAGPIHLLLSDMVMPEMSGSALARQILPLRPETVVLFMSGYADYPAEQATGAGLLQKPFTPDALARAVRGALDTPAHLVQPAAR
jgi:two-component system, cell cycle sensor histidine kinase and response regulator CckA